MFRYYNCMNMLDLVIIMILLIFMRHSYRAGFLDEVLTLMIILLASYLSYALAPLLAPYLDFISEKSAVTRAVSLALVFTGVFITGKIVKESLLPLFTENELYGIDKFLGMILGLAKGVIMISLMILLVSYVKLGLFQNMLSSSLISSRILALIGKYGYIVMI